MNNLNYFKNKYFSNQLLISKMELLDYFRNEGMTKNYKINPDITDYNLLSSIDLIKLISDKVFFFNKSKEQNTSIKNMLYGNKIYYQDFQKELQIESYLYRLINEKINRVLIFVNNFSKKNSSHNISKEQKQELINNMDNDIIYLSDQIILIRYQVYLPFLWNCRKEPFEYLKNVSNLDNTIKTYHLKNKWDFTNL